MKIAVLGGGSFGTVVANIAATRGASVSLWMRSEKQLQDILETGINTRYVPKYPLHERLTPTNDLPAAVHDAAIVFVAVPSKAFRVVVSSAVPHLGPDTALVSLTKGIEPEGFKLMSEVLKELVPQHPIGVISGPNLAKEIAQGHLAGTVVASQSEALRNQVHDLLSDRTFRVYTNPDVYGVELAGALKNIYAIASGMAAALGMGENSRALLLTRSLAEMSRFAAKLGANPLTFIGLAGVGDLVVTCTSPLSRNFRIGQAIGQGYSLKQAVKQLGETAEGVNTLRVVKEKADELGVYMPLVEGLYAVVHDNQDVDVVAQRLMLGERASDVEFIFDAENP
ncbi:MAG: NAD(P)H-dependent glycerol-3-phosphate dehydrogenase [Natronospirillum sp.]|uniref:NAD(P)H-dependent glycerol-3-phosphate dehydrogenase n=1 Tax=Natronospirillum sp. TaxID=2812955 RepID=UPI0025FAF5FF|nr:NAD(P)H-dependent glycerol-3-phosphate dehydrogenase [Natronospirillum sp.]MCH8551303.1 NAD(P)H-dependent glycerol-3-phosphate dehydrogenase [Natronospirillum sp.]